MMTTPRRLAVSGHLAPDFARALGRVLPEVGTRIVDPEMLTPDDLVWADSYCGFALPANVHSSSVRWVHLMSAGADRAIPVLRAMPSPPLLTRTVGTMPTKIAAYVTCHVLGEFQRTQALREQQAEHRWSDVRPEPHVGKTAVVLGTGRLGARTAQALGAVGFRTVGVSRSGASDPAFDAVLTPDAASHEYARCAVLVSTLPLTDETRHAIDAEVLGALDAAVFVNVGRGATVVEDDLRAALDSGNVRRAVLDVFETEPLPPDSWLWGHERVTVTPHIAAVTDTDDVLGAFVAVYADIANGELPADRMELEKGY